MNAKPNDARPKAHRDWASAALRAAEQVLIAAAYITAGKLGLELAVVHESVTAIWAPTGIALAALLLAGLRVWPAIFVAAFVVNITTSGQWGASAGIALGNTLEGVIGAYLVNRLAGGVLAFERASNVVRFALSGGAVSAAVAATIGVVSLWLSDGASQQSWTTTWLTWWLGDTGGAILVAPALILWWREPRLGWRSPQRLEAGLLGLTLIVVGAAVFAAWPTPVIESDPFSYATMVVLIWVATRFGPREIATATLALAIIAAWGTIHQHGPFASRSPEESLLLLQVFLITTAVVGLALASGFADRRRTATARAQLAAIVESSDDAIIGVSPQGEVMSWNNAAERIFGYSAAEMIGTPIRSYMPPERQHTDLRVLERALGGERVRDFETQRRRRDGEVIDISLTVSPIVDADGSILGVSKIARDISERKRAETELGQTYGELVARLAELERRSREIWLLNEMSELLQTCHTVEEAYKVVGSVVPEMFPEYSGFLSAATPTSSLVEGIFHWGSDDLAQRSTFAIRDCWALRRGHAHPDISARAPLTCSHLSTPPPERSLCVPISAGSEALGLLYLELRGAAHGNLGADTSVGRVAIAVAHQIGRAVANVRLRSSLESQAIRDPLTSLFNRRHLFDLLDLELRRTRRGNHVVSVILIDVDHFKAVNDRLGHAAGDAVLREVARRLESRCRYGDVVCRYGGEEFVVVLPQLPLREAMERAEALREDIRALRVPRAGEVVDSITISAGVAAFPEHGKTADALLEAADTALYLAKRGGRDRVVSSTVMRGNA